MASSKFEVDVEFNFNQAVEMVLEQLTADPSGGDLVEGRVWYRSDSHVAKIYNGTSVLEILIDPSYYRARANHTGTQLAATISDLNSAVRTNRLDQMAVPTANVSMNGNQITNMVGPSDPGDAATKQYVDLAIQGLTVKEARLASTANVNIASPGANLDGVAMAQGDRVLLKNQSSALQNGIYVFDTSSTPMTRADDMSSGPEFEGAMVVVTEGSTNDNTVWLQTANAPITVETTAISFVQFGTGGSVVGGAGLTLTGNTLDVNTSGGSTGIVSDAVIVRSTGTSGQVLRSTGVDGAEATWGALNLASANAVTGELPIGKGGTGGNTAATARTNLAVPGRYATDIGDGSSTTITVTHSLNTRDVVVSVYQAASPYEEVMVTTKHATVNAVTLEFKIAPTVAEFRCVVLG